MYQRVETTLSICASVGCGPIIYGKISCTPPCSFGRLVVQMEGEKESHIALAKSQWKKRCASFSFELHSKHNLEILFERLPGVGLAGGPSQATGDRAGHRRSAAAWPLSSCALHGRSCPSSHRICAEHQARSCRNGGMAEDRGPATALAASWVSARCHVGWAKPYTPACALSLSSPPLPLASSPHCVDLGLPASLFIAASNLVQRPFTPGVLLYMCSCTELIFFIVQWRLIVSFY